MPLFLPAEARPIAIKAVEAGTDVRQAVRDAKALAPITSRFHIKG